MADRAMTIALLLSTLLITGCGTVANLVVVDPQEGGKTPFGGVKHDALCIHKAQSESNEGRKIATTVVCAADMPFSFLGDVVTWPYTASYTFINQPVPVPPPLPVPFQTGPQAATLGQPLANPTETLPVPKEILYSTTDDGGKRALGLTPSWADQLSSAPHLTAYPAGPSGRRNSHIVFRPFAQEFSNASEQPLKSTPLSVEKIGGAIHFILLRWPQWNLVSDRCGRDPSIRQLAQERPARKTSSARDQSVFQCSRLLSRDRPDTPSATGS
jgi:uncharacterized protein YceK